MAFGQRRSPRKTAAPRTPPLRSGTERRRYEMENSAGEDEQEYESPRAISSLPFPSFSASHTPMPQSASPTRSASSGTSGASGRPRSPVKRLGDLQLSDVQVNMVTLGLNAPRGVESLCLDIRRIGMGKEVIPAEIRHKATALLNANVLDEMHFGTSPQQSDLTHDEFWIRAQELLDAAQECYRAGLYENGWNSEVHSRLLRLALRGRPFRDGTRVWYRDITAARITDQTLLPSKTSAAGAATAQSKWVDYALILEADPAHTIDSNPLRRRVIAKLRHDDKPSINQTAAEHVRFSPIAVSIETKRGAIDEDVANVQLAVWVSAHVKRLRQLAGEDTELPTLPLVIVHGHEWRLMFATAALNATGSWSVKIHRDLRIGATDSILGVYEAVASLRRLAEWVEKVYRPWFERSALALLQ